MTITQSDRSSGDILGFVVSGDVTKADYDVLTPAVEAAVEEHGEVKLMLDLTDFRWEKVGAWGADLRFGHEFHEKVARMAIVGHKKWEERLALLASPFYAREAAYFEDPDAAWAWLRS
ncbi:SpoIIAA family protein [Agromyces indicus]|uniref:STAS/SEC14 domain-containing protein n=1 Tax=Agromyces indicus TaxID=758919 RepID=A0ABU1FI13_9MICO|nr:STAS/SEC14 domain-containing protein [Agromyces indicus]MDR5691388.1 STAS/SEC14 domain-containing protein [Agromyces indicus]